MDLKEKIDIILITYNRKELLGKTLEQILAPESPIRDFEITVLNNASDDGTTELVNEYCTNYPNLKQIVNRKNIGGCGNIAKALVELPTKEYVWVICDNDNYNWSVWNEVEKAVKDNVDVIFTRQFEKKRANIFYEAAFLPACIYKKKNITSTVAENIYSNIKMIFPHLALISKNINDNNSFYIVSKNIVEIGKNPNQNQSFTRGYDKEDLPPSRKNIFWSVGYFSSLEYIRNKKIRYEIVDGTRHYHTSLFNLFRSAVIKNKFCYNNDYTNLEHILRVLNFKQRIKFIIAYLSVNFSFKNYKFYEMRSKEEWKEYLEKINEKAYIKTLSEKLKGKKVLLYGAGLSAQTLLENYDLSGFNITGISDKRFENTEENLFYNIKTIPPGKLKEYDFDVILFTLMLYKNVSASLAKNGVNKKSISLVKRSNKYITKS